MPAPASLWTELSAAAQSDPFLVVATGVFALAVLHAFAAPIFARAAHRLESAHAARVAVGAAPVNERGESSDFRAAFLHLLGEVEAVFGLWALVLFALLIPPIADALAQQGALLGLKVLVEPRPGLVAGIAATLSSIDSIVVMGHDVESSSKCLLAALESEAGYVGALGSQAMQQSRTDWLAYQDVHDVSRVHGPAGLNIGAKTPAEIAVSVAAEIIGLRRK